MRVALQRVLLATYKHANRAGLLDTRVAETVFQRSYFAYKRLIEDPFAKLMKTRRALFEGGEILDVGANIGYTARLFAQAVRAPHRVHAFEPEARNYRWLERMVAREHLEDRIVAHRAAVGASDGTVDLWHNPGHHGDHRIATNQQLSTEETQRVPLIKLDTYLEGCQWPRVAFIKIDVQGFEPEVLAGLAETLSRNPDVTVAVEVMPSAIEDLGFDPERFLRDLAAERPRLAILERSGELREANVDTVLTTATRTDLGYVDLVCTR